MSKIMNFQLNDIQKLKFLLRNLVIVFFFLIVGQLSVIADGMPIGIKAILPDNQRSKATYFDLRMEPGQQQTIEIVLTNTSDEEVTVHIKTNPGQTNDNGVIIYSESDKDNRLPSRVISFSDIANVDEDLVIAAKETKQFPIELKMPKESFDGIILGGIHVSVADKDEQEEVTDRQMAVVNKFEYSLGIRLTETDKMPISDILLKKVQASQVLSRNVIKVTLENPTMSLIEDIRYSAKIYKKGQTDVYLESVHTGYRLAPTSEFKLGIQMDNKKFEAGTYQLKLNATSEKSQQEWKWDEEFVITREEAKKLNEQAIDIEENPFNWMWIVLILMGLIVILLILFIWQLRKKDSKKKKKSKRKRYKR